MRKGLAPSNRAMKDGIGPYRIPDIRVTSTLVYTNKIRGTQLRGLGVPEGAWAIESQMDMIAERLGHGSVGVAAEKYTSRGRYQFHRRCRAEYRLAGMSGKSRGGDWLGKTQTKNVGRGLAVIAKSPTTHSSISGAHVQFNEDGSAQVMVGASEIGQGMCVVLSQIAAEALGIPVGSVGITCADTGATPYDRGTFSSRVTFYTGMAVKKAAEDAKKQLFEMASKMAEIPESDLAVENQRVVSMKQPQFSLPYEKSSGASSQSRETDLGQGLVRRKRRLPIPPAQSAGKRIRAWLEIRSPSCGGRDR